MIERLLCALFNHRYVVLMTFSPTSRKVGCTRCDKEWGMHDSHVGFNVPLYTAPPQREWQGLTDEEIDKTCETQVWDARRSYARASEAKLKEKNT